MSIKDKTNNLLTNFLNDQENTQEMVQYLKYQIVSTSPVHDSCGFRNCLFSGTIFPDKTLVG